MLAKLIVTANTREEAIKRMKYSIEEFIIIGVPNTLEFGLKVMDDPDFLRGSYNTNYIHEYHHRVKQQISQKTTHIAAAMATHLFINKKETNINVSRINNTYSRWKKRRL